MSYDIKFTESDNKWSDRTTLEIWMDDELVNEYFDGGEPEDNLFCRDWYWVSTELLNAYKKGLEDGAKN